MNTLQLTKKKSIIERFTQLWVKTARYCLQKCLCLQNSCSINISTNTSAIFHLCFESHCNFILTVATLFKIFVRSGWFAKRTSWEKNICMPNFSLFIFFTNFLCILKISAIHSSEIYWRPSQGHVVGVVQIRYEAKHY